MTEKIQAKFLATGDRVEFPRAGNKTVRYITNLNAYFITLQFTDKTRRALELEKTLNTERANRPTAAGEGEIERYDLETGRTSLTTPFFLSEFSDIRHACRDTSKEPIGSFPGQIARRRLEKGERIITEKAVYSMPSTETIDQRTAA